MNLHIIVKSNVIATVKEQYIINTETNESLSWLAEIKDADERAVEFQKHTREFFDDWHDSYSYLFPNPDDEDIEIEESAYDVIIAEISNSKYESLKEMGIQELEF